MTKKELQHIIGSLNTSIQEISGGDTSRTQKVTSEKGVFFIKSAPFINAKAIFSCEVIGLNELRKSKTIEIPKVIDTFSVNKRAGLILEYIKTKTAEDHEMLAFGRQLALMHVSAKQHAFGFETDNFIGKLPQINTPNDDWATFYVLYRLIPQLELALKNQELAKEWIPTTTRMILRCEEVIGQVTPALLHGDLWNGNYFISQFGKPYLVDPAVYYGHNEVDLALSKLFGGFPKAFYDAYHEIIPPHDNQIEVTDMYQLYYLLVHLNLSGGSYQNGVVSLLKKYFL